MFSERRGRRKKTGHEENDIKEKERGDVIELGGKKRIPLEFSVLPIIGK